MEDKLLKEFERLYQLQEMIADLTTKDLYDGLGTTDTHCINYIGDHKEANGVELAEDLVLTRGAISKITKRLMSKGYIISHKKEDNQKEVFYSLTTSGKGIYDKHVQAHNNWMLRDKRFLETLDEGNKEVVLKVLQDFNAHILNEMEEFKNDD